MSSGKQGNAGREGIDGSETKHKGESQQSHQKGAESVSKQDKGRHTKDKSHGVDENSTKKGANSV